MSPSLHQRLGAWIRRKFRWGRHKEPSALSEELLLTAARAEYATAARMLKEERTLPMVLRLVRNAQGFTDDVIHKLQQSFPLPRRIECKAGCACRCHWQVCVCAPEAICLGEFLRVKLSRDEFSTLAHRVAKLAERTRGMTPLERVEPRLPCALLVDRLCVAYPARPIRCRGWHSLDASQCQQYWQTLDLEDTVLQFSPLEKSARFILRGLVDAIGEVDLRAQYLELTAALRIALEAPSAAERWLSGEDVFKATIMRPFSIRMGGPSALEVGSSIR